MDIPWEERDWLPTVPSSSSLSLRLLSEQAPVGADSKGGWVGSLTEDGHLHSYYNQKKRGSRNLLYINQLIQREREHLFLGAASYAVAYN